MKTTLEITKLTALGELVTYFPDVTERLNAHHIDYCCQGDRSLEQAVTEAGLDSTFIDRIIQDYADYLKRPDKRLPVTDLSNQELINHILEVHHGPERALWTELDPMVNKIMLVHYEHGKELLLALHRDFAMLRAELEEHFAKEEREIFSAMISYDGSPEAQAHIRGLIQELEGEHEVAGEIIRRMIRLTDDFTPPEYACNTVRLVYTKLHELIDDLFLHISKENSVLFKRF